MRLMETGEQDELKTMVETQQSELRDKWGLTEGVTEAKPDETIDKLTEDLKKTKLRTSRMKRYILVPSNYPISTEGIASAGPTSTDD